MSLLEIFRIVGRRLSVGCRSSPNPPSTVPSFVEKVAEYCLNNMLHGMACCHSYNTTQ